MTHTETKSLTIELAQNIDPEVKAVFSGDSPRTATIIVNGERIGDVQMLSSFPAGRVMLVRRHDRHEELALRRAIGSAIDGGDPVGRFSMTPEQCEAYREWRRAVTGIKECSHPKCSADAQMAAAAGPSCMRHYDALS